MLLAACGVSPQSQQALNIQQQQCASGDQDARVAANYQAQANQAEAAHNNAVAATLGAALLAGVAAGITAGATAPHPVYVNSYSHYNHYNGHR
jgi:type 1 fimbria pilin